MPTGSAAAPSGARPRIPDSTPIYTPFIWIYVLLPLVPAIALLFWHPTFPSLTDAAVSPLQYERESYASFLTPGYFVAITFSLLAMVAMILMAFFDHRALVRAGVVRPFAWPWAFFVLISFGLLVYPIGRSVIARQVARPRGLAPIWVLIGTMVVQFLISIIWVVGFMSQVLAQIPSYR